jgi:hypothetical protein
MTPYGYWTISTRTGGVTRSVPVSRPFGKSSCRTTSIDTWMPKSPRRAKVEIRLFGEVELRVAGHVPDVGTPRRQAVLAA